MKPTEDRLYVTRLHGWTESESTLIVVEDRPQLEVGLVEAVGPGRWQRVKKGPPGKGQSGKWSLSLVRVPMEVNVGDRVLFDRYAGTDVEVGLDTKHTILEQREVLAVIE
jgi:chaperonin GroES